MHAVVTCTQCEYQHSLQYWWAESSRSMALAVFFKYFYLHSVYLLLVLLSATVKDKVLKYL